jgi:protein ImuB
MTNFACLFQPSPCDPEGLVLVAREFSPRYERRGQDRIVIDISGLDRLLGSPRVIAEEIRRDAASRGLRPHVAVAATQMAALVLASAKPGVTVVERGHEAARLAPISIGMAAAVMPTGARTENVEFALSVFKSWGLRTLGELAALPPADLAARLGQAGLGWQAVARGEDPRPLVPELADERFEGELELEWPIEGLEPLSFVLTRLLEPLSTRLERRDRGAAALFIELGVFGQQEPHARRLELPSPIRDVRTLRTLALLDLESHPPAAPIERVRIVIEPTPGRVLQHTLFARPHPTPEQLSTLMARLSALIGQDRVGSAVTVDTYRPGAFDMRPFATNPVHDDQRRDRGERGGRFVKDSASSAVSALNVVTALRRCRQPVPARVVVGSDDRPIRVTTDRQGFIGGAIVQCAGPWRTSGDWWAGGAGDEQSAVGSRLCEARHSRQTADCLLHTADCRLQSAWARDEWDIALGDGSLYRIFRDRRTDAWFIDAIVD